jgi:hypothetical protein
LHAALICCPRYFASSSRHFLALLSRLSASSLRFTGIWRSTSGTFFDRWRANLLVACCTAGVLDCACARLLAVFPSRMPPTKQADAPCVRHGFGDGHTPEQVSVGSKTLFPLDRVLALRDD